MKIKVQGLAHYYKPLYIYITNKHKHKNTNTMRTSNNNTATRNNENAKANFIALGIMALVIIVGLVYGMQLDAIGY